MNVHSTLAGHTAWEVTTPSGLVVASGERHNLITNFGLDTFATENGRNGAGAAWCGFRSCLRVGTGSAPPTATKNTLTAEIAGVASASTGGFDSEQSYVVAPVGAALVGTSRMVRVCNFTAPANLTEYGLSPSTSEPLSITELFRDVSNNPVAISVQAGFQLKLTHTLTVTVPFAPVAGTIDLGGGLLNTLSTFFATEANQYEEALTTFAPSNSFNSVAVMTAADTGSATTGTTYVGVAQNSTLRTYIAGSYQRTWSTVFAPASAVRDHYGWFFHWSSANNAGGYKVALTGGQKVAKSSSQKLTLDLTVSWGRA